MNGLGATVALSAGALLVFMVATWLLSLKLRDVSIVDVAWGLGFAIVAWICFGLGDGSHDRRELIAWLVTIWGLRLAVHIGTRKAKNPGEDPRYGEVRKRYGDSFWIVSLYWVFLLQGLLALVVSLPIQGTANSDDAIGALDYIGVAL